MKQRIDIPPSQRNKARMLARDCWKESKGDRVKAELLVEQRMSTVVGSIFVSVAIQIAIALIKYWWEHRTAEPSAVFQAGEPYIPTDEDGEWT